MNWTNDSFLTGYSIINPIKRVRIFELANAFMYRPNFTRSESDIDSLPNSDASSSRSLEIEFLRISSILCDLQIEQKSNRFLSIPKTQKKKNDCESYMQFWRCLQAATVHIIVSDRNIEGSSFCTRNVCFSAIENV